MSREGSTRTLPNLAGTLAAVWLGCVVYVLLEQLSGALTLRDFQVDPLRRLSMLSVYYWLPWLLMAPLVAAHSRRFPIRPDEGRRALMAHLALLVALAFAHGLAISYVYHYSGAATDFMRTFEPWQHTGHFLFGDDMLLFDVIVYAVLAASLNIRNFHRIVRQQELDASRLNERLAELRFQTLRMQINPHFLFNALNAIAVLINKNDTKTADRMVRGLSRFFRQTLESSGEHWVALEEELDTVRQYIEIGKIRFGERLRVREECDPAARRVPVPALLLQPLVENAMTHGLGEKTGDCELSLVCRRKGGRLRIEIRDDGVGGLFHRDPEFEEGIGLANVRARLEQMYGGAQSFDIDSAPGRGTRITIELPVEPQPHVRAAV